MRQVCPHFERAEQFTEFGCDREQGFKSVFEGKEVNVGACAFAGYLGQTRMYFKCAQRNPRKICPM